MIIKIPKLGAKFLSLPLLEDINIEGAQWKTLNSFQSKSQDSVSFQAKYDVYAQREILNMTFFLDKILRQIFVLVQRLNKMVSCSYSAICPI